MKQVKIIRSSFSLQSNQSLIDKRWRVELSVEHAVIGIHHCEYLGYLIGCQFIPFHSSTCQNVRKRSSYFIYLCLEFLNLLTHYHIKYHHQDEADGKTDGAEVRVLTAGGFGDELLDYDVEHSSGGKGKHVREDGHEQ